MRSNVIYNFLVNLSRGMSQEEYYKYLDYFESNRVDTSVFPPVIFFDGRVKEDCSNPRFGYEQDDC